MPLPTIARVVEIKRNIDLVYVIMSDGTYRFRSKSDLTQQQIDDHWAERNAEGGRQVEDPTPPKDDVDSEWEKRAEKLCRFSGQDINDLRRCCKFNKRMHDEGWQRATKWFVS